MITAYQQAQQAGQSAVRATILDAAVHLLLTEGPAALTVRRISTEAGCSTKVIYTLFGGKDGLSEALWLEGFAKFESCLKDVPDHPDPLVRLVGLGYAYRSYALTERVYYRVMFDSVIPGFEPSRPALDKAKATFGITVDAVAACLTEGRLQGGEAEEIADLVWMAVHGAVSLELSGYFDSGVGERRFDLLCASVLHPFLPPNERTVSWPRISAAATRP
jgi:AcrR family transcriptional regulator